MAEIEWDDFDAELDERALQGVERQLGVHFPDDYRNIVRCFNGGTPSRTDFDVRDLKIGTSRTRLAVLLSFDATNSENIVDTTRDLDDQLPRGVIPIGATGFGDFICYDYRASTSAPSIVYWFHERVLTDSIAPLASSFSAFLEMLEPPDDDMDDL